MSNTLNIVFWKHAFNLYANIGRYKEIKFHHSHLNLTSIHASQLVRNQVGMSMLFCHANCFFSECNTCVDSHSPPCSNLIAIFL